MASMVARKLVNIDYKAHLMFSVFLRLILIGYGVCHDRISDVPYTDVDYQVFTDAARHILRGNSPYERHTFRYSPLIAVFLIPNVLLTRVFGKLLFSLFDILVGVLIRTIVLNMLKEYNKYSKKTKRHSKKQKNVNKDDVFWADVSMYAWLYNPLTVAISTRGNCDSLACFLVLFTLFLLQCKQRYFLAGIVHGLSIHFRLYPVIYSLTYFMFLSKYSYYSTEDRRKLKAIGDNDTKNNVIETRRDDNLTVYSGEKRTIFKKEYVSYLVPNWDQIKLISGCVLSLSFFTGVFYVLYGYTFIYETYLYHFVRKDTRHNFSLYFYLQYITAWVKNIGMWQKVLIALPQIVLLLVFSVRYGLNRFSLNFAVLTQTVVMVIYNGVLTSQYFVWVLAVLPLCLWQIKMPSKTAATLPVVWFVAQGAWLLPAYLLEFRGQNTFLYVWIQSVSFFCVNITILGRLVVYFMPVKEKV